MKINLYYHEASNTWWTNSKLKDLALKSYLEKNGYGLGAVSTNINNELQQVSEVIIPDAAKFLSGFKTPEDIQRRGIKITHEQLSEILKEATP